MADAPIANSSQRLARGQVREALDRLEGLVVDGLKHGFFDHSNACEIGNGGKRRCRLLNALLAEALVPDKERELEAAE
jgi:hypothetical protein